MISYSIVIPHVQVIRGSMETAVETKELDPSVFDASQGKQLVVNAAIALLRSLTLAHKLNLCSASKANPTPQPGNNFWPKNLLYNK